MQARSEKPVFVVGMNGSGTTMLLDCLGHHPALYAFPVETRLIPWLLTDSRRYGDLGDERNFHRVWEDVAALPAVRQVNGGAALDLPENWKDCERSLPAVIDKVLSDFARDAGKRRWCEKTPQHVQHITMLADAFPDALFVHMIRDGRDSAASFHRRWGRTPQLSIYRWKKVVAAGARQGRALGNGRYLEIKYEDVTAEPATWLRVVCRFLEVPFDDNVLSSSAPYLRNAESGPPTLRPNSGKWRSYFSAWTIRSLETIAGATLADFGYATNHPDSDRDPGPFRRRVWVVVDAIRQFAREIFLKLTGKLARPWSTILRRPLSAYRQGQANRY